ncbi:MAG: site-specific integrase [Pseudomonadota bacterium]
MATYKKLQSGHWRAQIRQNGRWTSRTFRRKSEAETWATVSEQPVHLEERVSGPLVEESKTFGCLLDLHVDDMLDIGRPLLRSKSKTLEKLKSDLGRVPLKRLRRECLIDYGKSRAKEGAGPATVGMDFTYIKTILVHASAVHGIEGPTEQVTLARVALSRLGIIGKSSERHRRPTQDELDRIIAHHEYNPRQNIPLGLIVKFAVATAMRQDEICSINWSEIDLRARMAMVRDRKDPRSKQGNDQKVPLLDLTGYDAVAILEEQRRRSPTSSRVFPYNGRSVGTAFRRACRKLEIDDLRFHDLRHEATSRLFEAGLDIPEVSLVTGHKDWKMLRRYLNLQPEQLVQRQAQTERQGWNAVLP